MANDKKMVEEIREETVRYCYGVTVNTGTERKQVIVGGEGHKDEYHDDTPRASEGGQPQGSMPSQAPKEVKVQKPVTVKREEPKVGRNDACPCGSGKKYKNCCGKQLMGLVPAIKQLVNVGGDMELSTTYILSQVFIIISYVFLISTYQFKNRKTILLFGFLSLIMTGVSHFCLSAFRGLQ